MEFQMWKDYLQLSSVIQAMLKAEISEPPPLKDFVLSPAERPEEDTMNGQSDPVQLDSFFTCSGNPDQPMGYPYPKMKPDLLPTNSFSQANSDVHSAEDQATETQPNSLSTYCERQPNCQRLKTSVKKNLSPHGETQNGGLCFFCMHNGESRHIYMGHNLKDEQGRVVCPILRMYSCSLCGATGEKSHTKKYCPLNNDKHCLYKKSGRNSAGRKVKR